MAKHIETGLEGEEFAAGYLTRQGYEILHRNWRHRHKEVDIIALHNNTLVIIEVKTRKSIHFENPREAVTKKKQRFLIQAANAYIEKYDIDLETRFDIVEIIGQYPDFQTNIISDAFYPLV